MDSQVTGHEQAVELLGVPIWTGGERALLRSMDFPRRKNVIVPVNADVLLQLHEAPALMRKIARSDAEWRFVLDSQVLKRWTRISHRAQFEEQIAGSTLLPALARRGQIAGEEVSVFVLGGLDSVAERAAAQLNRLAGRTVAVGWRSPSLDFETDEEEIYSILQEIREAGANTLAVGFGALKQERWCLRWLPQLPNIKLAICVGATLDFLAGEQRMAPRWWRRLGLEWAYRLVHHPKRLAPRYLRDLAVLCDLTLEGWNRRSQPT